MAKLVKVKSLAIGSPETYYDGRVKPHAGPALHFQVGGLKDYASVDLPVSAKLSKWTKAQTPDGTYSLSGSNTPYLSCQYRLVDPTHVKVQIPGTEFNRPYGAVFVLESPSLAGILLAFGEVIPPLAGLIGSIKCFCGHPECYAPAGHPGPHLDLDEKPLPGQDAQGGPPTPDTPENLFGVSKEVCATQHSHDGLGPTCVKCGKPWGWHFGSMGSGYICPCPACGKKPGSTCKCSTAITLPTTPPPAPPSDETLSPGAYKSNIIGGGTGLKCGATDCVLVKHHKGECENDEGQKFPSYCNASGCYLKPDHAGHCKDLSELADDDPKGGTQ